MAAETAGDRRYALGVDLGTTWSAAAVARGDRAEIATLGTRTAAIPSVVVLHPHGDVLVGEAAERRSASEPTRTGREFKRRLGDPVPIVLGGTPYGAEALMAHVLRWIVDHVAEMEGAPPALVVVSHPANYGDYKKDLLREAIRLADVSPVELVTEPEAAAIHYASLARVEVGEVVAVYDFGGGTFDAAVVRRTDAGFELIGEPEGMERFGGIDIDQAVFAHVVESLGGVIEDLDDSEPATLTALAKLRDECRLAKEALSEDTDVSVPVLLPNVQTEVRLTRAELEAMVRPRLAETVAALERAVRSAGLGFDGVSRVLLVGGSSRMPLVADVVREATGRPVAIDAHPKHSIALGAARAAAANLAPSVPTAAPAAATAATAPAAPPVVEAVAAPTTDTSKRGLFAGLGIAALVAVVVLAFLFTRGGGDDEDAQQASATSTPTPTSTTTSGATETSTSTASLAYPPGATDRFEDFCREQGVPGAVCTCVVEDVKDERTYPEFVAFELALYADPDSALPDDVTKIFEDCTERHA